MTESITRKKERLAQTEVTGAVEAIVDEVENSDDIPNEPFSEFCAGATMLVDISGFTKLTNRLLSERGDEGAEILNNIINRFFEELISVITRHAGDVIKFVPTDKGHNAENIDGMLPEGAETFKSGMNKEFELTVDVEGLYGVKCTPHYAMGMVALIQVGEPVNLDDASDVKQRGKARDRMAELLEQVE